MTRDQFVIVAYIVGLGALALFSLKAWLDFHLADRRDRQMRNSRGAS